MFPTTVLTIVSEQSSSPLGTGHRNQSGVGKQHFRPSERQRSLGLGRRRALVWCSIAGGEVGDSAACLDEERVWLCSGCVQSSQRTHPAGRRVSVIFLRLSGLWESTLEVGEASSPRAQVDKMNPSGPSTFPASRVSAVLS